MLDPTMLAPEKVRPLLRREYEQLVELGVFEDERIELLRGQLVTMSPQGPPHATVTARLAQHLIRALDDSFDVRSHSPFAATDDSEPEPDVSVSRRQRRRAYHPSQALLLIEVAMRRTTRPSTGSSICARRPCSFTRARRTARTRSSRSEAAVTSCDPPGCQV